MTAAFALACRGLLEAVEFDPRQGWLAGLCDRSVVGVAVCRRSARHPNPSHPSFRPVPPGDGCPSTARATGGVSYDQDVAMTEWPGTAGMPGRSRAFVGPGSPPPSPTMQPNRGHAVRLTYPPARRPRWPATRHEWYEPRACSTYMPATAIHARGGIPPPPSAGWSKARLPRTRAVRRLCNRQPKPGADRDQCASHPSKQDSAPTEGFE